MFLPRLQAFFYQRCLKPFLFRKDPEEVHDRAIALGKWLGRFSVTRTLMGFLFSYKNPSLEQMIFGISFPNPIGLTGGFDKNAELIPLLPSVGFGFMEVGSITHLPCPGNPKPRLWRLPKSHGLLVWYGLKNDGAQTIAKRIEETDPKIPLGINIARTNLPVTNTLEAGTKDYVSSLSLLGALGSYFTINVSCPNTCGGEPFTVPKNLDHLLTALDAIPVTQPIFLKVSVDLSLSDLDEIVKICDHHQVHGFVISNLTKKYDRPEIQTEERNLLLKGGVSGVPVRAASNALISHLYKTRGKKYLIIGSGGVFCAEDAYEKIRLGASLVQLATGMIFLGPQTIGQINKGLVELLKRDGYSSVSQAVGAAHLS